MRSGRGGYDNGVHLIHYIGEGSTDLDIRKSTLDEVPPFLSEFDAISHDESVNFSKVSDYVGPPVTGSHDCCLDHSRFPLIDPSPGRRGRIARLDAGGRSAGRLGFGLWVMVIAARLANSWIGLSLLREHMDFLLGALRVLFLFWVGPRIGSWVFQRCRGVGDGLAGFPVRRHGCWPSRVRGEVLLTAAAGPGGTKPVYWAIKGIRSMLRWRAVMVSGFPGCVRESSSSRVF